MVYNNLIAWYNGSINNEWNHHDRPANPESIWFTDIFG